MPLSSICEMGSYINLINKYIKLVAILCQIHMKNARCWQFSCSVTISASDKWPWVFWSVRGCELLNVSNWLLCDTKYCIREHWPDEAHHDQQMALWTEAELCYRINFAEFFYSLQLHREHHEYFRKQDYISKIKELCTLKKWSSNKWLEDVPKLITSITVVLQSP